MLIYIEDYNKVVDKLASFTFNHIIGLHVLYKIDYNKL